MGLYNKFENWFFADWGKQKNSVKDTIIAFCVLCFLGVYLIVLTYIWGEPGIQRLIFTYMGIIVLLVGLISGLLFLCGRATFGKYTRKGKVLKFVITVYVFCSLIFAIPVILILIFFAKVIEGRAKKMEIFERWIYLLFFNFIEVFIAIYPVSFIWEQIVDRLYKLVNGKYEIEINEYAVFLFLLLASLYVIVFLTNSCLLKRVYNKDCEKLEIQMKNEADKINKEFSPDDFLSLFFKKKKQKLEKITLEKKQEINRAIKYPKYMLWKAQLITLIFLFLLATFIPDYLFANHQSDAINVITIFTLIMLFVEKNNLWNEKIEEK